MKDLEQIKKDLKQALTDELEYITKLKEEKPSTIIEERKNPEYLRKLIEHIDEILPIYMASVIREQLESIHQFSELSRYKEYQDYGPKFNILKSEDLEKMRYIYPGKRIPGKFENRMNVEKYLTEIMKEYGFEMPSLDEIDELEKQGKYIEAIHAEKLRGHNSYPSEPYIVGYIPSEHKKTEQGNLSKDDLENIAKESNPRGEEETLKAIVKEGKEEGLEH